MCSLDVRTAGLPQGGIDQHHLAGAGEFSTGTLGNFQPALTLGQPHDHFGGHAAPPALRVALRAKTWDDGGREVAMATQDKIDWSECPLVEIKPGVQGGAPVLRGTRMPVNAIVDNFGVSVAEIAEQFDVPPDCIETIVACAQSHRDALPV